MWHYFQDCKSATKDLHSELKIQLDIKLSYVSICSDKIPVGVDDFYLNVSSHLLPKYSLHSSFFGALPSIVHLLHRLLQLLGLDLATILIVAREKTSPFTPFTPSLISMSLFSSLPLRISTSYFQTSLNHIFSISFTWVLLFCKSVRPALL